MKLKHDEQKISSIGEITVTNERIIHIVKAKDSEELQVIPKNSVTGISVKRVQQLILLQLGIMGSLIGLAMIFGGNNDSQGLNISIGIIVVSLVLIGAFFSTRKHLILISSSSITLSTEVKGTNQNDIDSFVNSI